MFLWKNGKLHAAGASFAIPEGLLIGIDKADEDLNYILLQSPDEIYQIQLCYVSGQMSSKSELEWLIKDHEDFKAQGEITPAIYNGLTGHCLRYSCDPHQLFQLRFDTANVNDHYNFIILISSQYPDITPILNLPAVKSLLNSLTPSDF